MSYINANAEKTLHIGKQGENLVTRVDFSAFLDECRALYGLGTLALVHQRAEDEAPYPVALTEGVWTVTSADLAQPGTGLCELTYVVGDVVKKSLRWKTVTLSALGETVEPPEAWLAYIDSVIRAAARAESAAHEIEDMTVEAETLAPGSEATVEKTVGDVVNLKFGIPQGLKGDKGNDGYSPSAHVQRTDKGARITIVDQDGISTAEVRDGKDGKDGKDGENAPVTTIASFDMDENGVLYCETVTESSIDFSMNKGVLEVRYGY